MTDKKTAVIFAEDFLEKSPIDVVRFLVRRFSSRGLAGVLSPHFSFQIYRPTLNQNETIIGRGKGSDQIRVPELTIQFSRRSLSGTWKKQSKKVGDGMVLGFNSIVSYDESQHLPPRHYFLMNFTCKPTKENLDRIKNYFRRLAKSGVHGFLFQTERSFHFYSLATFSEGEWIRLMGKMLLFSGTDRRYIGHSLVSGFSTLRMTAGGIRKVTPKCVAVF